MRQYQEEFIQFIIEQKALCFGEYTLKSGRASPYFFNSGRFHDGPSLARLGGFYAETIQAADIEYDMLFGPAYKGIPLVSATAMALYANHAKAVPYCCNRKEVKDHGEGGITLGAPLAGRVLVIDDVISAGISINLSVEIIRRAGAEPVGFVIAVDRQERGAQETSATQEVEHKYGALVYSIITLADLVAYLENTPNMMNELDAIKNYQKKYGVSR